MTVIRTATQTLFKVHHVHPADQTWVAGHDPALAGGPARSPIDIEALVSWAVRRSGALPWGGTRDRELMFDQGLTAKAKRKPHVDWATAEACAGIAFNGRPIRSRMTPGPDGARVLLAIGMLDPAAAALVLACGRGGIRPDWMPGVEPRLVAKSKRCRKGHRRRLAAVWEPCSPEAIRLARDAYRRWHAALTRLADQLDGALDVWEIAGFAAPGEPWRPV